MGIEILTREQVRQYALAGVTAEIERLVVVRNQLMQETGPVATAVAITVTQNEVDTAKLNQMTKKCVGPCGKTKPILEFHKSSAFGDGRNSTCADCLNAKRRAKTKKASQHQMKAAGKSKSQLKRLNATAAATATRAGNGSRKRADANTIQ